MTITILRDTTFGAGEYQPDVQEAAAHGVRVLANGVTADGYGPGPDSRWDTHRARFLRLPGDGQVASGNRAEFTYGLSVSNASEASLIYGYAFSAYYPSPFMISVEPTGWYIPGWQIHAGSGQPALNVEYEAGQWMIKRRRGTSTSKSTEALITVPLDEYVDWVIIAKWAMDNTGWIKIWQSGELIVDIAGVRTNPRDVWNIYPKNGVYTTSSVDYALLYCDWVRMASATTDETVDDIYTAIAPTGIVVPPEGGHLPNPSAALRAYSALVNSGLRNMVR